ncbi:hypothetical protein ACFLTH_17595 [Bacteroidota bacterium]
MGVSYNNDFRVTSQTINNADTITFDYDDDGLLTSSGDLNLSYNPQNGLLNGTSLNSISAGYSYNSYGEVTGYNAEYGTADLFNTTYVQDSLGRIKELTETINGVTNNYKYNYTAYGYLEEVLRNDTTISVYDYDANGNRISAAINGVTDTASYDAQDRMNVYGNTLYAYTDKGDLRYKVTGPDTTIYFYDDFGNLTNAVLPDGTFIDYIIDAQNRRIAKKINGLVTKRWLYQDQLNPVAEIDSAGNIIARYVYGSRINPPNKMAGKCARLYN